MSRATVLHADLDAFFASVEQRDDPALRGKPVIVGGGVVMACSYEARALGVRSAMGASRWRALCPDARVVSPRFEAYTDASKAVFDIFRDTAPHVEAISIDEAFLEVGGLDHISGTPLEIAARLRRRVRAEVGLPITVGVARTKSLAKVASQVAKPDGLLLVPPEDELGFLHPLPVERLWGAGPKTVPKLHARGITTIGDLAALPETALVEIVGRASGRHLHALAHGRDPRAVRSRGRRRSIGSQSAFGLHRIDPDRVDATLVAIVDRVMRRLRKGGRSGRTVVLRLRFGDYTRATRSHTLPVPTATTEIVLATARQLLAAAQPLIEREGLTMVGLTIANLDGDDGGQLELPLEDAGRRALDAVLDEVLERFGPKAVTRAARLHEKPRLATWLHPGDQPDD